MMDVNALPDKIINDPITSAVFEMRFSPAIGGLADLLPGMLYPSLGKKFPTIRSLPFGEVPIQVKHTIPDWHFHAVKQMSSESGQININLANSSVSIEVVRPYVGWNAFRSIIIELIDGIKASNLVTQVERYSFRYQNLLDNSVVTDLSDLRTSLTLGDHPITLNGLSIRSEINYQEALAVIQIITNIAVMIEALDHQSHLQGTMLDIDMMMNGPYLDFFETYEHRIEELHRKEKEIFFSLLSETALQRLERGENR